jgi:hypothetical protein
MTHDLLKSVIEILGAKVIKVVINDIDQSTFFARLFLDDGGGKDNPLEVDSRPSDAIALALRVGAPIYVTEKVIIKATIADKEKYKQEISEVQAVPREPLALRFQGRRGGAFGGLRGDVGTWRRGEACLKAPSGPIGPPGWMSGPSSLSTRRTTP